MFTPCRLTNSFQNIQHALNEMAIEEDLKKYADQKGTGMAMNWPKFVVCMQRGKEKNVWNLELHHDEICNE